MLAWAAVGLAVGACSDPEAFARPDRRLEGTSWRLETLGGQPLAAPPGAVAPPTLTFKGGFASWTVGCQTFDAQYRTQGDRLVLREQPGRRIGGCEPFERPVRAALSGDGLQLRREGRRMTIRTPAGLLEARRTRYQPIRPR